MKRVRSPSNNAKRQSHTIGAKTAYVILMIIGMPILLALSAIAASPSSPIQLTYSQRPPTGEQLQEQTA
jgi:hypothetical protein